MWAACRTVDVNRTVFPFRSGQLRRDLQQRPPQERLRDVTGLPGPVPAQQPVSLRLPGSRQGAHPDRLQRLPPLPPAGPRQRVSSVDRPGPCRVDRVTLPLPVCWRAAATAWTPWWLTCTWTAAWRRSTASAAAASPNRSCPTGLVCCSSSEDPSRPATPAASRPASASRRVREPRSPPCVCYLSPHLTSHEN